jgi:hypothetical protein
VRVFPAFSEQRHDPLHNTLTLAPLRRQRRTLIKIEFDHVLGPVSVTQTIWTMISESDGAGYTLHETATQASVLSLSDKDSPCVDWLRGRAVVGLNKLLS